MKLVFAMLLALTIAGCESIDYAENSGVSPSAQEDQVPTPQLSKTERVERFDTDHDDHVGYHNPNTGYSADYTLDVEKDADGNVERINFPNGGYEDDLVDQHKNGDGTVTVTDEDGREFTVEGND